MAKTTCYVPDMRMADKALVDNLTTLLQRHKAVHTAYLFGSQARGSQGSGSDVDIAVAFAAPASAWDEVELQERLTAQLGVPVQVVDLSQAGRRIIAAVSKEGIRLVGDPQVAVEGDETMGEKDREEARSDPRTDEAIWLLESAADKVQRLDRALPLLADIVPEAVLAGDMVAVRDFVGVFMLLIEPLETLLRRVSRYAHLLLEHPEPEATLRAQTALAAQVMGLSAAALEGIGTMVRLRGRLAHAYWELDEQAIAPLQPERLQPVLEHLIERASRFVLVEQGRWQRSG